MRRLILVISITMILLLSVLSCTSTPATPTPAPAPDETEEAQNELFTVQIAVIAMMLDNELTGLPMPVTTATNDMSTFPDKSVCGINKIEDPNGNAYTHADKDGYLLYQHDITADSASTNLVDYLIMRYTKGTYIADAAGSVWELTAGTPSAVIYEITGTAKEVGVTLSNATGGTEQYSDVSLPKKYTYNSFSDSFLYISAQNQGESGSVTVSIYVNGKLFKTSRSSGAYVIASASGSR